MKKKKDLTAQKSRQLSKETDARKERLTKKRQEGKDYAADSQQKKRERNDKSRENTS